MGDKKGEGLLSGRSARSQLMAGPSPPPCPRRGGSGWGRDLRRGRGAVGREARTRLRPDRPDAPHRPRAGPVLHAVPRLAGGRGSRRPRAGGRRSPALDRGRGLAGPPAGRIRAGRSGAGRSMEPIRRATWVPAPSDAWDVISGSVSVRPSKAVRVPSPRLRRRGPGWGAPGQPRTVQDGDGRRGRPASRPTARPAETPPTPTLPAASGGGRRPGHKLRHEPISPDRRPSPMTPEETLSSLGLVLPEAPAPRRHLSSFSSRRPAPVPVGAGPETGRRHLPGGARRAGRHGGGSLR
jgi:hypothetical protein